MKKILLTNDPYFIKKEIKGISIFEPEINDSLKFYIKNSDFIVDNRTLLFKPSNILELKISKEVYCKTNRDCFLVVSNTDWFDDIRKEKLYGILKEFPVYSRWDNKRSSIVREMFKERNKRVDSETVSGLCRKFDNFLEIDSEVDLLCSGIQHDEVVFSDFVKVYGEEKSYLFEILRKLDYNQFLKLIGVIQKSKTDLKYKVYNYLEASVLLKRGYSEEEIIAFQKNKISIYQIKEILGKLKVPEQLLEYWGASL